MGETAMTVTPIASATARIFFITGLLSRLFSIHLFQSEGTCHISASEDGWRGLNVYIGLRDRPGQHCLSPALLTLM
jgi:hypothetical protein